MSKYFHHRWKRNTEIGPQYLPTIIKPRVVYNRLHERDRRILKYGAILLSFFFVYIHYRVYTFDYPYDRGCLLVTRNRFHMDPSDTYHPLNICKANVLPSQQTTPNIVHYVLTNLESLEFPFMHYVSIMSTYNILQPDEIMFHYVTLPKGKWFDRIKDIVTLVKVEDVTEIFGNPVEVPAHKSDILRMSALMKYGGIYLDLDVIVVRPFTPLMRFNFVMGYLASLPGYFNKFDNLLLQRRFHINGINNAVIISEPESFFLLKWYNSYRNFNDKDWSYHSVEIPTHLADQYPDHIIVLAPSAFYFPTAENFPDFFSKNEFDFTDNFAVHLWNHITKDQYMPVILNEEHVMNLDSSFGSLLRYVLLLNTTAEIDL